jgi:alpha-1,2-mannosyltransferase
MRTAIIVVGVAIIEIATAATLAPRSHPDRIRATDFVNFYMGATLVRQGDGGRLYQRPAQDAVSRSVLGYASGQYYLHPPFEAAMLAPLSRLNVERAFLVWSLVNVGLLGLLPLVLMPGISLADRRPYVGWAGFCFLPALTALTLGQDSILLLFIVSSSYLLMRKEKDVAAGLVLALAAIKFQYLVILAVLLLCSRKWRVCAGIGAGCAGLGLISILITGPRGLWQYFQFLGAFEAHAGYGALNPALMVSLRGFLTGIGVASHLPWYVMIGGAILLALGMVWARMAGSRANRALSFALCLSIALAAAPYAHFSDMTMLLLPVLLAMDYVAAVGMNTLTQKLIAFGCALMFLGPFLLLILGGHYWWNSRIYLVFPLVVLFIGALAAELYSRAAAKAVADTPAAAG